MPWFHAVVEAQHEISNPTSRDKILLLGERLGLGADSRVLDLASGQAGPAIVLAGAFGCHLTCVESDDAFHAEAVRRVRVAGLDHRITLVHGDAAASSVEPGTMDAVLCLGASFIWDGLTGTLDALLPVAREGGTVAIGEPYWRTWPLPDVVDVGWRDEFEPLPGVIARFTDAGLAPVTLIDASVDDWDRYETLQWRTGEAWLAAHPDDADAPEIRATLDESRDRYVRWQRELLGWVIVVGLKPARTLT
jgi:SAM-dependent methyltransferase